MTDRFIKLHVPAMDCPVEEAQLERILQKEGGFVLRRVDFSTRTATLEALSDTIDCEKLLEVLEREGLRAQRIVSDSQTVPQPATMSGSKWLRLGLALFLAVSAETLELMAWEPKGFIIAICVAAILMSGIGTLLQGFRNLFALRFRMDTLMAVAVLGACLLREWPEAAMVMTLFEIGEAIEAQCVIRSRNAIASVLQLKSSTASVLTDDGWKTVDTTEIFPGMRYRTAPGERLAADGILVEAGGDFDESAITGEATPASKGIGDLVWAGALVLDTAVTVRATHPASESMCERIARMIEDAERNKAPSVRFVDRFAAIYTPTVFGLALIVALLGETLSSEPIGVWLYRALVILVIACPCALVIATPVAVASALTLAARNGVLVKGGNHLEAVRELTTVALDKTGTLTTACPKFSRLCCDTSTNETQAWRLAASIAQRNTHPVSQALALEARVRKIPVDEVDELHVIPGYGVQARIGKSLLSLTNLPWLEEHHLDDPLTRSQFEAARERGDIAVALSDLLGVLAVFTFSDTLRSDAKAAVASLHRAGLKTVLLTGDTAERAEALSKELGINAVHSSLLPQDKCRLVEELDRESPIAMVGDGINDAPALARSRIGFAMGLRGTDTAIDAADVVLMDERIGKIAWLKHLSELTYASIRQIIGFALGAKALFAALALAGLANMWIAVFADTGVCLMTTAWAIRILRMKPRLDSKTSGQ